MVRSTAVSAWLRRPPDQKHRDHGRQQRRTAAEPRGAGDIRAWGAARASCSGRSTRSRVQVSQASKPGKAKVGRSIRNRRWSFFTVDVARGLVFAPSVANVGLLRRRSKGRISTVTLSSRSTSTGESWVVPTARPPRPMGLRSARGSGAFRCEKERPHDPAVADITKMWTLFIFDRNRVNRSTG